MRISINGQFADVPRGTKLSFTKKNNALNFGNLEFERSLNFSLPKTEANEKIFLLADDFHTYGTLARKRLDAQILMDSVTLDGYLYVSSTKKSGFDCVFVFGDLIPIKNLSEKGEMANWITLARDIYNINTSDFAVVPRSYIYKKVEYENGLNYVDKYPSFDITKILKNFSPIPFYFGNISDDVFIISDKLNKSEQRAVSYSYQLHAGVRQLNISQNNAISAVSFTNYFYDRYAGTGGHFRQIQDNGFVVNYNNIQMTFPYNFPNDIFLINIHYGNYKELQWSFNFVGGYSFDTSLVQEEEGNREIYGTPLAGRTITIDRDTDGIFAFYDIADFRNYLYQGEHRGFVYGSKCPFQTPVSITTPTETAEIDDDTIIYAQDNLPNITLADILNIYRYIFNIYVTFENGTIKMNDMSNIDGWQEKILGNVISVESVERKFADFAQKNTVEFDSEDYVGLNALKKTYFIENQNLSAEKTIVKLKVSEGLPTETGDILLKDIELEEETNVPKGIAKKPTIAIANVAEYPDNLQRVYPFANNIITDSLCKTSTKIKINCFMSAIEYFNTKENIIFRYNGCRWLWVTANWSDGKASFELQKYE